MAILKMEKFEEYCNKRVLSRKMQLAVRVTRSLELIKEMRV